MINDTPAIKENKSLFDIDRYKKKTPAPHARAEQVVKLCELFSEDVKSCFEKWNGATKQLPVSVLYDLRKRAEKNGTPPKRLFIYLMRDWKKKYIKKI